MRLLAISTSTEYCSAALLDGALLLERELPPERAAGERILELVDALLAEAGISLKSLDAIAFGRGPGAFTGVRLAASITQGLAAAAGLPVMAISDLQAVAQQALEAPGAPPRMLICQDARMHQVYWGWFAVANTVAEPISSEGVAAPAEVAALVGAEALRDSGGAGSGFDIYAELQALFKDKPERVQRALHPRAREIAWLAAKRGLAAASEAEQAQPVYVRDQVAALPPALT